jgi:hypothetical protein
MRVAAICAGFDRRSDHQMNRQGLRERLDQR